MSPAPFSNDMLDKMGEGDIPPFVSLLEKLPLSTCTLATPRFSRQDDCDPSNCLNILADVQRFGLPAQYCK